MANVARDFTHKANRTEWNVFVLTDGKPTLINWDYSYGKAVERAQIEGCTENRPIRRHAGFYELIGDSGTTYCIATDEACKKYGFKF